MGVITITDQNFEAEVVQHSGKVLIDFWASWCGPCKMLSPIVDQISEEVTDVKIGKVNVDEQMELAQKYGVVSIPTLVVMENGEVVQKAIGLQAKQDIMTMIGK